MRDRLKRIGKIFGISSVIWILVLFIFNNKLVWKIAFIGWVLFWLKYLIDLYLRAKYQDKYGLQLNASLEEKINKVCVVGAPIVLFVIITLFKGGFHIVSLEGDEIYVTFLLGTWFAGCECYIFTNTFMKQVVETLLPQLEANN